MMMENSSHDSTQVLEDMLNKYHKELEIGTMWNVSKNFPMLSSTLLMYNGEIFSTDNILGNFSHTICLLDKWDGILKFQLLGLILISFFFF